MALSSPSGVSPDGPPEAPVEVAVGAAGCEGESDLDLVCGIAIPEDLVAIPDTPWIVASSLPRGGKVGGLFLIDTRKRIVRRAVLTGERAAFPSTAAEAAQVARCAPPDFLKLTTHGLALGRGEGGVHRLYAVGHGAREAIELFTLDASGAEPVIRWAGCVPMPEGIEANSVVPLPGGGLMFTSLYDRGETDWSARIGKLAKGAPAGGVYEWHAVGGLRELPIPPMSGPNGIAVSVDGKALYLAGWGDKVVRKLDRKGRETAPALSLAFLPDNLHWAPDGSLLASGQRIGVAELFACTARKDAPAYCAQSWSVARIDPRDLSLRNDWHRETGAKFGDSTAAVIVDGRLWLGAINGDCVAVVKPDETAANPPGEGLKK